jgi:hypothetical protein
MIFLYKSVIQAQNEGCIPYALQVSPSIEEHFTQHRKCAQGEGRGWRATPVPFATSRPHLSARCLSFSSSSLSASIPLRRNVRLPTGNARVCSIPTADSGSARYMHRRSG